MICTIDLANVLLSILSKQGEQKESTSIWYGPQFILTFLPKSSVVSAIV